jgi:hypothetical protein
MRDRFCTAPVHRRPNCTRGVPGGPADLGPLGISGDSRCFAPRACRHQTRAVRGTNTRVSVGPTREKYRDATTGGRVRRRSTTPYARRAAVPGWSTPFPDARGSHRSIWEAGFAPRSRDRPLQRETLPGEGRALACGARRPHAARPSPGASRVRAAVWRSRAAGPARDRLRGSDEPGLTTSRPAVASPAGFEPATFRLEGGCSGPLSYGDGLGAQFTYDAGASAAPGSATGCLRWHLSRRVRSCRRVDGSRTAAAVRAHHRRRDRRRRGACRLRAKVAVARSARTGRTSGRPNPPCYTPRPTGPTGLESRSRSGPA